MALGHGRARGRSSPWQFRTFGEGVSTAPEPLWQVGRLSRLDGHAVTSCRPPSRDDGGQDAAPRVGAGRSHGAGPDGGQEQHGKARRRDRQRDGATGNGLEKLGEGAGRLRHVITSLSWWPCPRTVAAVAGALPCLEVVRTMTHGSPACQPLGLLHAPCRPVPTPIKGPRPR